MSCPITLTNTDTTSITIGDLGNLSIPAGLTIQIDRYYSRERLINSADLETAITASNSKLELKYAGTKLASVAGLCITPNLPPLGDATLIRCYLPGNTNTIDTDFFIQPNLSTSDLPVLVPIKSKIISIAANSFGANSTWSFNVEVRNQTLSSGSGTVIVPSLSFNNLSTGRIKFPDVEVAANSRLRFRFLNASGSAVERPNIVVKLREIN